MSNIDIVDECGSNKIFTGAFLKLLLVSLISQISGLTGYTIDGIVTSRFSGGTAIAATGLFVPLSIFMCLFSEIVSKGNSVICSNKIGAMRQQEASRIFSSSAFLALSISIFLTLIFLCFAPFWAKLVGSGANDEIQLVLVEYIRGIAVGIPGMATVNFLAPVVQLEGDNHRVTTAAVVLCISNIIGDFINVLVIRGGMFGMGITSSISYYISSIALLSYFLNKRNTLSFRFSYIKKSFSGYI